MLGYNTCLSTTTVIVWATGVSQFCPGQAHWTLWRWEDDWAELTVIMDNTSDLQWLQWSRAAPAVVTETLSMPYDYISIYSC